MRRRVKDVRLKIPALNTPERLDKVIAGTMTDEECREDYAMLVRASLAARAISKILRRR